MAVTKGSVRVFEGEAKMSISYLRPLPVQTKRFSPLLDKSIMFYFKAWSKDNWSLFDLCSGSTENFLLTLVKSPYSKCYPSFVMSVDVSVYYYDETLLKKYQPQTNIKVDHLNSVDFETVTMDIYKSPSGNLSDHFTKMLKGDLTLRYRMTFDDISKTALSKNVKSSLSNFSNNLKCVYESAAFSDFVFNLGDKSFPAHRVILVAHSPVFMKMVTQDFVESKTNRVTITDTTPEIFEMFLKYLYCGEIEDKSWPSVKDLYCLADKYDVGILKNDCTGIVISLLCIDLVCEILNLAYIYDDSSIKSAAKKFSVDHIKELLPREDWKELVVAYPIIGYDVIVNFVPT